MLYCRRLVVLLSVVLAPLAWAGEDARPSIPETAKAIIERLRGTYDPDFLLGLDVPGVVKVLTPEERRALASDFISFEVNVPVEVFVIRDVRLTGEPFWLEERGFAPTGLELKASKYTYEVWKAPFPAGKVGLGINSLMGSAEHYFVALAPQQKGAALEVAGIEPPEHTLGVLEKGARPYTDGRRRACSWGWTRSRGRRSSS